MEITSLSLALRLKSKPIINKDENFLRIFITSNKECKLIFFYEPQNEKNKHTFGQWNGF